MFSLYGRWEALDRLKILVRASLVILMAGEPFLRTFIFLVFLVKIPINPPYHEVCKHIGIYRGHLGPYMVHMDPYGPIWIHMGPWARAHGPWARARAQGPIVFPPPAPSHVNYMDLTSEAFKGDV